MKRFVSTAIFVVLLGVSSAHSAERMAATGQANPIRAWHDFCQRYPDECRFQRSERESIRVSPQTWSLLRSVNLEVNAEIRPLTDRAHWNQVDIWDFAEDGSGDCEDYQLLKRRRLVAAGLPRRALRMTVVLDHAGEGHAVLMVRTDRGDYILDNKTNAILRWDETGYTYLKRESGRRNAWVSLGNRATAPATAGY